MIRNRRVLLAKLIFLLGWTSSCAPATDAGVDPAGDTDRSESLRFAWQGDLTPMWHPSGYETFSQAVMFFLLFNKLVRLGPDLTTILPDLAESWEVSPDARVFTFRLRRDVRWHDGEPFTARDVEFSFSRQLLEPYRYVKYAGEIAGAEAYEEGSSDRLEGLEAIDDFTVRITLGGTDVTFLQKLAEPSMVIIPSHLLAGVEPDAVQSAPFTTTRPVGTGPFRFVKYLTDLYVELESNPDYFRGAPLIRRVYMKRLRPEVTVAQLESGELDLGMRLQLLDYDRLAALSHLETTTRPGIGMISVGFALDRPVVQDRRLRQAIYCAIDRKAVARTLFRGRAEAMEGIPLGMDPDARLDSYGHDLERAKRLLRASGFDPATPLRLIYDQTYPSAAQIYPIIGQQLRALGLRVQLEAMESTAFIARRYEQRDTYEMSGSHGGAYGLGPHVTSTYFNCRRPDWQYGYTNCDLDRYFAEATATVDPERRRDLYFQAARLLNRDLPLLPLWAPDEVHARHQRLGGGFELHQDARRTFGNIETWTLNP